MKLVRKFIPLSLYDIPGIEQWLEEQAQDGLFPTHLGSWATFKPTNQRGYRFRLDVIGRGKEEPSAEQLELYRQGGWEYACSVGRAYHLFYTTDPNAPELFSDYQSRGLSIQPLKKAFTSYRRRKIIIYSLVAAALIWALFFFESKYDVQPDHFAFLPLVLLHVLEPTLLLFLLCALFMARIGFRDYRTLRRTYSALIEGLPPPPSPGPSKWIAWENKIQFALIVPLILFILVGYFDSLNPWKNISLDRFNKPYLEIQELEQEPVYYWEELFEEAPFHDQPENYAEARFSFLAPTWYSVTQEAYSSQAGTMTNAFSPDPEGGKYRYSPDLDMTYFHLLLPALARPVAHAQLDSYRLVNLEWSYEEINYPGLDFVILATHPDQIWQMAALGRGGNVAVFRYAGVEQLSDHLGQLAAIVL
ncbi:MAG: DUF2812 domain-containing protein [Lawsonibacter sp.]|jgi:hypothetical protein